MPSADLPVTPLGPDQILAGAPVVRTLEVAEDDAVSVGLWEHSVGTSSDVEADEVFVVLSGRATVRIEGGPTLELGPGDVGTLAGGARTVWTVHEDLRKVFVSPDAHRDPRLHRGARPARRRRLLRLLAGCALERSCSLIEPQPQPS